MSTTLILVVQRQSDADKINRKMGRGSNVIACTPYGHVAGVRADVVVVACPLDRPEALDAFDENVTTRLTPDGLIVYGGRP